MDKIAILDYGSQYTHLIATRIRRLGVYSEILDPTATKEQLSVYKGIILSGGPASVYEKDAPSVDPEIFKLGIPILGICYGHQLMTHILGGKVEPGKGVGAEFGKAEILIKKPVGIFADFLTGMKTQVWMSHGDKVTKLPAGFEILASSDDDEYSAVGDISRNFYGIQFHTEVKHSTKGEQILLNFLKICNARRDWDLKNFIDSEVEKIRTQVGDKKVFLMISGGVDSTVAFVLLNKALGPNRVYGLFVDTGFMRENERVEVETSLREIGVDNLHVYDATEEFYTALEGIAEPEKKREIIGRVFLEVQKKVSSDLKLDPENWLLAQGTIYPDTIESGGTKNSSKIKTHHNRVPEIEKLIAEGKIIEPLKDLYKDEVREVGQKLGLHPRMVWRHPFPGPGLAVRILCAAESDLPENSAQLDHDINTFLLTKNSHLKAQTLPIKSVGVQGDFRTYRHPVLLSGPADWSELGALSPAITNKFDQINRVLYLITDDITPTFSPASLTKQRSASLRMADKIAMDWLREIDEYKNVWQMPVVLIPINGDAIVLRPIVSEEAMTANFAQLPMEKVKELAAKIMASGQISAVMYDVTNKPPATIEWE